MSYDVFTPPEPALSLARLPTRRTHLLAEIERARAPRLHARLLSRFASQSRPRRLALVVALVLLVGGVGTAVGVGINLLAQVELFHRSHDRSKSDPHPVGSFVYVTRGSDWALIAWRSTRGICIDYAIPGKGAFNGAGACGMPVVGAPPDRVFPQPPTKHVVGYFSSGSISSSAVVTVVAGPTAPTVARVEIELRNGQILPAQMYDAPPKLQTHLRFYLLRAHLRSPGTRLLPQAQKRRPDARLPINPVRAIRAYDKSGKLLERFPVPP